ncbi:hypothetical protein [Streptococcus thoraltensis]|uniref:hypothetical protein n=1 Tax=Streptococcus thoraltensis TaxID=55085 RepID=UPI001F578798|nr:hypothetical protein [Streptococcus thoraltensis]
MSKSDQINQFFNRILSRINFTTNNKHLLSYKALTDDDLSLKYAELKSINVRSEKLTIGIVSSLFLASLGGLWYTFSNFAEKVVSKFGATKESGPLLNGSLILMISVGLVIICLWIFYLVKVRNRRKEYHYVELLMKERDLI